MATPTSNSAKAKKPRQEYESRTQTAPVPQPDFSVHDVSESVKELLNEKLPQEVRGGAAMHAGRSTSDTDDISPNQDQLASLTRSIINQLLPTIIESVATVVDRVVTAALQKITEIPAFSEKLQKQALLAI